MFVAGTVASGGFAAAATVCGAADAIVAVGDTVTTIMYGNDSKQAAAYSDFASGVSSATCLFTLAGFNKIGTAVEKMFWLGTSFMDKKQEVLDYIEPMVKNNELGLQMLRVAMTDQTLLYGAIDFNPAGHLRVDYKKQSGFTKYLIWDKSTPVNDAQGHTLYYEVQYGYATYTNSYNNMPFTPVVTIREYPD